MRVAGFLQLGVHSFCSFKCTNTIYILYMVVFTYLHKSAFKGVQKFVVVDDPECCVSVIDTNGTRRGVLT